MQREQTDCPRCIFIWADRIGAAGRGSAAHTGVGIQKNRRKVHSVLKLAVVFYGRCSIIAIICR